MPPFPGGVCVRALNGLEEKSLQIRPRGCAALRVAVLKAAGWVVHKYK